MAIVTKQGRNLLSWLKHFKLSSRIADQAAGGSLTEAAKEDEQRALKLLGNMVKAKYKPRWARGPHRGR